MRFIHLFFCLVFGFLGAHRFIVGQKMHGLLFLILSVFTILLIGNPATEYISVISLMVLLGLIAIDAITVLLTGRYIAFEGKNKEKNNDKQSHRAVLNTGSLQHKIMCVRISKSLKRGLSVYDAARYAWKVSEQSISDVDFVLGVDDGRVVGVFQPYTWLPGDHPDFQSLSEFNDEYSDRFGFIGKQSGKKAITLYLNKTIEDMTGKQGGSNPVRFFGSTKNKVKKVNVQTTPKETGASRSMPKSQSFTLSGPKILVLIAYEINAEVAKKLIQKRLGISANLKKFKSSEIVGHVTSAWSNVEDLMYDQGISPLHKILYTVKLSDPLRVGHSRNDIVNNSFLMSVISDNSMFGKRAIDGGRFYDFTKHSDFEQKQFSIFLDEIGDKFSAQEVGIFCWIEIDKNLADLVLKHVASHFSPEKSGELHFLEFTNDGRILPNFANVSTQKFEGKLAGNFSLSLSQEEYQEGMDRLNKIAETVVGSSVFDIESEQMSGAVLAGQQKREVTTKKKTYSDGFKRQVALAANEDGATLASVGQQFDVSPTLVRNWKYKFSENIVDTQMQGNSSAINNLAINDIQNWLQLSQIEGTIDGDGDLSVSFEVLEEAITEQPQKIYLIGSQKLASGGKSETFDFESEVTTNESNWFRSDYLNGVDKDDPSFALNMKLACHACSDLLTIPVTVKEGTLSDFPKEIGNIKVSELSIILEDGDYCLEGRLIGENGFIYGIETLTEEPNSEQSPRVAKVADDENTAEVHEFFWDAKKGDTVYIQLANYTKLDGEIAIGFTGKAEVQEPEVYDEDESKFWPPSDDSRSPSDPKGCALYLKGAGYEFSASRLSNEDFLEMKRLADEDIDAFLSGGRLAENAGVGYDGQLADPKYGLDPLDASFSWEDFPEEDNPTVDDQNFIQVEFVDDPTPEKDIVDYVNVAEGKVFGSISIPVNHPSEFDPEKLRIEYFEFSLDGYPEQYGRIIERIEYDGWQIELEWEDNGLDVNTFLIGYELDNEGELEDHLVIYNSHGGEHFDFDWELANKIFSSETVNKPKSIMDLSSQPIGSMEFKIEVASACAESGMNYLDFAELYNLNAEELNSWAVEFLGGGFQ
jgi:transposase-like protein/TM2 domain-containing membrane protein YozV